MKLIVVRYSHKSIPGMSGAIAMIMELTVMIIGNSRYKALFVCHGKIQLTTNNSPIILPLLVCQSNPL